GLQAADAEDVGQEVFRAVSRSVKDFHHDQEGGTFRGWLRAITRNKVRDLRRRDRPEAHGAGASSAQARLQGRPQEDPPSDCAPTDSEERLLVLRRAVELVLADCEERTRQAFWRAVVEGRPVAEVAEELGMTKNAVYGAKFRVLGRLKQEFGPF